MKRLLFAFALVSSFAYGDSFLTSTNFWRAYIESTADQKAKEMISFANESAVLNPELIAFLLDDKVELGAKLALANALFQQGTTFGENTTNNAAEFQRALMFKYKKEIHFGIEPVDPRELIRELIYGTPVFSYPEHLSADELTLLGYFEAQRSYLNPSLALPLLFGAVEKDPSNYAVRIILSLVIGNMALDNSDMVEAFDQFPQAAKLFNLDPEKFRVENKLGVSLRWAYAFAIVKPLMERQSEFKEILPKKVTDSIFSYAKHYEKDYVKWEKEQSTLRSQLSAYKISCEASAMPQLKIWTDPAVKSIR